MATTMPTNQDTLKKSETYSLISADKVEGTDVYNPKGDHLGEIDDVMIDKVSGKVAYAVISFGGFLGMGEEHRALPWSVLTYNTDLDGYVINAADDIVRQTPLSKDDDYSNEAWGTKLHGHYGVDPYWV